MEIDFFPPLLCISSGNSSLSINPMTQFRPIVHSTVWRLCVCECVWLDARENPTLLLVPGPQKTATRHRTFKTIISLNQHQLVAHCSESKLFFFCAYFHDRRLLHCVRPCGPPRLSLCARIFFSHSLCFRHSVVVRRGAFFQPNNKLTCYKSGRRESARAGSIVNSISQTRKYFISSFHKKATRRAERR